MSPPLILWADVDAGDFIKIIFGILFVLLPLVGKFLNMVAKPEAAKRPPPPPPNLAAPKPPPKAANPELNSEVEEFLRRAAERRMAEQRREVAPAAQKPQQAPQSPPRRAPVPVREERPKAPPKKQARKALQAEVVDDVKRGESVEQHVSQHFKSRPTLERSVTPRSVDQADESMQEHLHAVFDHRLGSLARSERTEAKPAEQVVQDDSVMAANLALMLRDPQTVRQAIVLNEILSRPEHRW